jgi:hypothetical protein
MLNYQLDKGYGTMIRSMGWKNPSNFICGYGTIVLPTNDIACEHSYVEGLEKRGYHLAFH